MYIQNNQYSVNTNNVSFGKKNNYLKKYMNSLKQSVLDLLPNADLNVTSQTFEKLNKLDKRISRPAENRAIMGVTALATQPLIDSCNHKVDEETRIVSRNRTIAKILAGTLVGIAVRGSSYNIVKAMTELNGGKRYSKALIPKAQIDYFKKHSGKLSNYRSALSTAIAILAMCFTNFAIDAPLTVYLTNKFNQKNSLISKKERTVKNE